jgi:hypothetical protein
MHKIIFGNVNICVKKIYCLLDAAWRRTSQAFNSSASQFRSVNQLKSKYDNLKTKTRKVVAKNSRYKGKTCGGGACTEKFDAVIEAVLRIININYNVIHYKQLLHLLKMNRMMNLITS